VTDGDADVLVRHGEDGVSWVTLNRPARLNALAGSMRDQLADAVTEAAERAATRAIVLTGSGRAFCAGADLAAVAELLERDDADGFMRLVEAGMRVVRAVRAAPKPVVAAINGVAAGAGASLAAACDLRVTAAGASIGFTFIRVGLHPDWGATFFLPRLVGAGRAAELFLTGRVMGAREAHAAGIFQQLGPEAGFNDAVAEQARALAAGPPLALARLKRSLAAEEAPLLEEALRREAEAQRACFGAREAREGVAAFLARRAPRFPPR
jgi:2-(1,2-epoxy-1,2-dihydrophenyl)acetyl-CoA isomerase